MRTHGRPQPHRPKQPVFGQRNPNCGFSAACTPDVLHLVCRRSTSLTDQGRDLCLQQDMQNKSGRMAVPGLDADVSCASVHPFIAPPGLCAGLTCMISSSSRSSSSVKLCLSRIASMGELCAKLATLQNMVGLAGLRRASATGTATTHAPLGLSRGPSCRCSKSGLEPLYCESELALRSALGFRRPSAASPAGQGVCSSHKAQLRS